MVEDQQEAVHEVRTTLRAQRCEERLRSKRKAAGKYPNGTVIVKTVAQPGDRPATPSQVAVMRKVAGRWKYVEWQLSGSRYGVIGQGQFCAACHAGARANDYVFTK